MVSPFNGDLLVYISDPASFIPFTNYIYIIGYRNRESGVPAIQ